MKRENIEEKLTEEIVGGSIVFSPDKTTCGLNCNDQCKVNDFDAVISYISEHHKNMSEKDMMRNMSAAGLITRM